MKFRTYDGRNLKGCSMSMKIDGVQVRLHEGNAVSRDNNVLRGVDPAHLVEGCVYEAFDTDWETTVGIVRAHERVKLDQECLYQIHPEVCCELVTIQCDSLNAFEIKVFMDLAVKSGFEGLVIKDQDDVHWKVKPVETYDVLVTDVIMGKGKYTGMLGAVMTSRGKVGTGFTDEHRKNAEQFRDVVIEVECMGLTKNGKFRHPRFKRIRFDKTKEMCDESL